MATIDRREAYQDDAETTEAKHGQPQEETQGDENQEDTSTPEEAQEVKKEEDAEDEVAEGSTTQQEETAEPEADTNAENDGLRLEKEKLSKEIVELRKERREVREAKKSEPLIVDKDNDLNDVAQSDIELIEKVLRSKGVAFKQDLEQKTYSSKLDAYQDEWMSAHPEYLPENDPEDKNWNKLKDAVGGYFKTPNNPKDIKRILDLAHQMVSPRAQLPKKDGGANAAGREKIQASSKSGGVARTDSARPKTMDLSGLKGFTDDEKAELLS